MQRCEPHDEHPDTKSDLYEYSRAGYFGAWPNPITLGYHSGTAALDGCISATKVRAFTTVTARVIS